VVLANYLPARLAIESACDLGWHTFRSPPFDFIDAIAKWRRQRRLLISFIHAGCRRILSQHLATSGARARAWWLNGGGSVAIMLPPFGTHLLKRHANHEQLAKRRQQQQQQWQPRQRKEQQQRVDKSKCSW